jgi:protein SCO1/2
MIALALTLWAGCAPEPAPNAPAVVAEVASPVGPSLYELPVALVTQDGVATDLGVARGHPTVIGMIYTTCSQACPMLIGKLQAFDAALEPSLHDDVRYVLVSLDPEQDTPESLRALAAQHGLDERFILLRGDEDATDDVAAVLGLQHRRRADGSIDHATVVSALSRDGVVVGKVERLADPLAPLADALSRLPAAGGT